MLSLYEILKASKTGIAPNMWTALAGMNWGGADSGHEVKELIGIPPLSFTADGSPLISWRISGNTVQSTTPTPQNPIMPQGTGERTGNLFSSIWEQGSINGTTGQNEVAGTLVRTKDYIPIKPNIPYSFSRNIANGYMNLRLYRADKSYIGSGTASTIRLISGTSVGNPMRNNTFFCCFEIIDNEAAYIRFNDSSNNTAAKWLMVEGKYTQQTMPDYEPYGYKIPISSANATTPVYLGEVESTRKIKKYVFTGTETGWRKGSTFFFNQELSPDYLRVRDSITCLCSHYPAYQQVGSGADIPEAYCSLYYAPEVQRFYIKDNNYATLEDFTTYLAQQYAAGTPVTVWYVLATEETAVVNEPLMKIGNYADEVSNVATIPTNNGSTTIDVNTTVKPSEIYIKDKGV